MVLGFIIVGWPKRTKEFGPSLYYTCIGCESPKYHHYTRVRRWLTIWFLPMLPLGTAEYYATCDNCSRTEKISLKEDAKRYKKGADISNDFLKNAKESDEYWPELHALMDDTEMLDTSPSEVDESEEVPTARGFQ